MLQSIKNRLKDQRGLTLIELLAVIVILGIIAAIAVPSINGIINNSKKDAHIANAQQMVSAARMAVAGNDPIATGPTITLANLEAKGFLETVESPSDAYNKAESLVTLNRSGTHITYTVTLKSGTSPSPIKIIISDANVDTLTRDGVTL